ncbi:MAG TPA: CPBP family intramembrane metalloprotease [Thermoanaerobaculia bacterium]|nr:CPBP family intramembrane metalloprotease [Thermoanaerobaculia bacterium]
MLADLLPKMLAMLAAAATAVAFERLTERRGLMPPAFSQGARRLAAVTLLAGLLYVMVWSPLLHPGEAAETGPGEERSPFALFLGHGLFAGMLLAWHGLGYQRPAGPGATFKELRRQLGLVSLRPAEDFALGIAGGFGGWLLLPVVALLVAFFLELSGAGSELPQEIPQVTLWIAGLPVLIRIAVGLSAGLVEEAFFRGFLQPRLGILASTFLFVAGHASYQPLLQLVGLTVFSLLLALLTAWRQSIVPSVVAHAFFDLWQLLVVVPLGARFLPSGPALAHQLLRGIC